jgi:Flp pilus assembly CpaE family ATPase
MMPTAGGPPATGVVVLSAGAAWEITLLPWLDRDGLRLVRRCVDVADLLAVCAAGTVAVAVVDAAAPRLDRDVVARLRRLGVLVLAVDPAGGQPRDLDAADVVAGDVAVATLSARVRALARRTPVAPAPVVTPAATQHAGRLVAVWGPSGAPGRTTVAVNLATELARSGRCVLLVDADAAGGAVATTLGILDEAPGVAAACRTALRGRLDPGVLAALAVGMEPRLRVLTGSARPDRWRELRPAALDVLWETARSLADDVVVDVGPGLAGDEPDPLEPLLAGPSTVTASVLGTADVVLGVCAADPLGLVRLVHALDLLREQLPAVQPALVVNRVRSSVTGPAPVRQVRDTLARTLGVTPVAVLPDDPGAADAALRAGRPLADAAAGSPLRRGISQLATSLLPGDEPATAHPAGLRRARRRRSLASVS